MCLIGIRNQVSGVWSWLLDPLTSSITLSLFPSTLLFLPIPNLLFPIFAAFLSFFAPSLSLSLPPSLLPSLSLPPSLPPSF